MELEGSLQCSKQPLIVLYPEPHEVSLHLFTPISLRSFSILSSNLRLGLPSGLFPSGFRTAIFYVLLISSMRATFPAYIILFDLIILIICGEACTLWSSSLWSLLQSPATSSFLGPNILATLYSYITNLQNCNEIFLEFWSIKIQIFVCLLYHLCISRRHWCRPKDNLCNSPQWRKFEYANPM